MEQAPGLLPRKVRESLPFEEIFIKFEAKSVLGLASLAK